MDAAVRKREEV